MRNEIYLLALFIWFWSSSVTVIGQKLLVIKPTILDNKTYTRAEQIAWQKTIDLYNEIESGKIPYSNISEQDKNMVDSLENGFGPYTLTVGCSWYCGGGPYKMSASSQLKEQGDMTYLADNIHDFNLFTAWIPDKTTGGIGEKIHFHFKPFGPRLNEIIIWNGYSKNSNLWKANSRAARCRLFINEKPTAILELKDISNAQSFKIAPVQSTDSLKDLVLTLEITEVYKGDKYDDVAISEINFNGLDVHCFVAGTQITMADGSFKNIESITVNDYVMSYDFQTQQTASAKVSGLIRAQHRGLLKLTFSDREIITTDDHPFFTESKRWKSINPDKSNGNYEQQTIVEQLSIGDKVLIPSSGKYSELKKIEILKKERPTYTIALVSGDSFIANGLCVKTEVLK